MTDPIATRVQRGAAWLDDLEPDWRERVELAHLHMGSPTHCILGQVFAGGAVEDTGYDYAIDWAVPRWEDSNEWAIRHGFACSWLHGDHHDELRAAWSQVVLEPARVEVLA